MSKIFKVLFLIFICISLQLLPNVNALLSAESVSPYNINYSHNLNIEEIMSYPSINSLKTEYADAYKTSDSQITYVVNQNKINYRDKEGTWQTVNDEIVPINDANYSYQNKANNLVASFGLSSNGTILSRLVKDNYSVEFSFQANQFCSLALDNQLKCINVPYLAKLNNQVNSLVYKDVLENADLIYTVDGDLLKEDIVFYSKPTIDKLHYAFKVKDLLFKKITSNSVSCNEETGEKSVSTIEEGVFYDSLSIDKEVFRLSDFIMYDADGRCSELLHWNYYKDGDSYILLLNLDTDFLSSSETKYPVVIDPTVQGPSVTFDTFASRTYPDTNYYLNSYVRTGKDSTYGMRRTFIKWTLPSITDYYPITTAQVQLKKYTSSGATNLNALKIYTSWSSSTLTWWNSPNCDTDHQVTSSSWSGDWQVLDVSMIMRRWDCGLYTNYGVKIFDDTESDTSVWATFYSSDYATTSYGPKLVINLETGSTTWDLMASGGYSDNVIYVENIMDTYSSQFLPALSAWTNSPANCYIYSDPESESFVYDDYVDDSYYGMYIPYHNPVEHFTIVLNTKTISEDSEWDGFARDVLIHELGHALWLEDQPSEEFCIMGYQRDRDSMLYPTLSDITGVDAKWP